MLRDQNNHALLNQPSYTQKSPGTLSVGTYEYVAAHVISHDYNVAGTITTNQSQTQYEH